MGLDITAYEHVELSEGITLDERRACRWKHTDGIVLLCYAGFPERADGIVEGLYRAYGARVEFHAGSYSGYNRWREQLATLVGLVPETVWRNRPCVGPFVELIDFSDSEGFIGPKTSAKLHADFMGHLSKAEQVVADHDYDWWLQTYKEFTHAFGLAAQGGVVRFH